MTDLPTWLIEIVRQFPMVVVIGLAVWYAEKRVREKEIRLEGRADQQQKTAVEHEDKLRAELRKDRDAELRRYLDHQKALGEANAKLLEARDEQITVAHVLNLERRRKCKTVGSQG